MADAIYTATYKFKGDNSDLKSTINENESMLSSMSSKVGSAFATVGKVVAAGISVASAAIGTVATQAVNAFSDYEQLTGGVETLFKDSSDILMGYADKAFQTAGLSANAYMETATGFAARLLQGLGGDTAEAAKYADLAITDMADNANKMGTAIESIQWAYQGFAKQNYTMLDNLKLGYGGTASEMARLINDSGVLGDTMTVTAETVNSVSFDKIIDAIHIVQDNLGITGTTALEASTTIQGSVNAMKGAWENLLVGIAGGTNNLESLINNFVSSVGTAAKNIIPVFIQSLSGIANVITEIAPLIAENIPVLVDSILPPLLDAASQILLSLLNALPNVIPPIVDALIALIPELISALLVFVPYLYQGFMQIVYSLIQMLPTLLPQITQMVIDIVKMLVSPTNLHLLFSGWLQLMMTLVEVIPEIITMLIEALPDIITSIITFLTDPTTIGMLVEAAITLFFSLVKAVPEILGALLGAFGELVGNLWTGITSMFGNFAANFGEFISGIFKTAINGVLSFIEGFINAPIKLINGFIDIINGAFGFIGVNLGKIDLISLPRLYTGGIVEAQNGGTPIIAGDGGEDEWVIPESKMGSLIEQLESRMGENGGGDTYNIYVEGVFATSPEEQRKVAQQIADTIRTIQKQKFTNNIGASI